MTKKVPIRNLHSDKQVPPRFCDVVIDNGKVYLEKNGIVKKSVVV